MIAASSPEQIWAPTDFKALRPETEIGPVGKEMRRSFVRSIIFTMAAVDFRRMPSDTIGTRSAIRSKAPTCTCKIGQMAYSDQPQIITVCSEDSSMAVTEFKKSTADMTLSACANDRREALFTSSIRVSDP